MPPERAENHVFRRSDLLIIDRQVDYEISRSGVGSYPFFLVGRASVEAGSPSRSSFTLPDGKHILFPCMPFGACDDIRSGRKPARDLAGGARDRAESGRTPRPLEPDAARTAVGKRGACISDAGLFF
jgi:hypothetical protein